MLTKPQSTKRRSTTRYHYSTYGLTIASDFELPELVAGDPHDADVEIVRHPIESDLAGEPPEGQYFRCADGRCYFSVDGVARYLIERGNRIEVEPVVPSSEEAQPTEADVRLYLLGSALGAALHQRGWLPLHVSAVAAPSGVWAFSGPSGAGKSTIAAWLNQRGHWPVVCDDVAVLRSDDLRLHPGPPRLKLWRQSLSALGIDTEDLTRDLSRFDKFHLRSPEKFASTPQPLRGLVMLEQAAAGSGPSLERLHGADAFRAIMASIYRPEMAQCFSDPAHVMGLCSQIMAAAEIYRYRRAWSLEAYDAALAPLLEKLAA